MQTLSALVEKWRAAGMETRVRQELWIMLALTLGGPLDPNSPQGAQGKGKGKAVERTDETKMAMVEVLLALMKPDEEKAAEADDDDDPLGERIDWSAPEPATTSSIPTFAPPPVPILFHTLTTLLALSSEPTSLLELQLLSLDALRILLFDYLARPSAAPKIPSVADGAGPSPLLATALPGTASTLSRIALSKPKTESGAPTPSRRQASNVVVSALRTLSQLVVISVGDLTTASLRTASEEGSSTVATLEELGELNRNDVRPPSRNDEEGVSSPPPNPPPTGPTIPTPSWLRFTLLSISTLLSALSPLATHESPLVRAELVHLLSAVTLQCPLTLQSHLEDPLEGLLALASDDWEEVSAPARQALLGAFASSADFDTARQPVFLIAQIVQHRLAALPRSIRRQDEHAVQRGAAIVRAALELLPTASSSASSTSGGRTGVLDGLEKWSWGLLSALDFEPVAGMGQKSEGKMALAWITSSTSAGEGSAGQATSFPPVRLRAAEEEATVLALAKLWKGLGAAAVKAGQEGEVLDLFLGTALGPRRGESAAASALWVLDGAVRGMEGKVGKAQKKVLKRAVRDVMSLLEELELADEQDDVPAAPATSTNTDLLHLVGDDTSAAPLIERKKGVSQTPSLDKYNPAVAAITSRNSRASHLLLLTSFSLRLLSTLATLLASSFQPFLMQTLYHVLAHLSPTTHPFLRTHAQHALLLISKAISYPTPQSLVLANVDYVVNSVSQRLSISRLEPNAPLVLVEMIRLVGKPIVPMVQDLVDDVFEALDDYHGYEELTVGLWAVLDALLKVVEEDLPERSRERKKDVIEADSEGDWRAFEAWYAQKKEAEAADPPEEEINPQRPFETGFEDLPEGETGEPPEDVVIPPTRPQMVTAQILSKALYFLSHPSPFLRARVLSLIASAVPLLSLPNLDAPDPKATRSSDLLPVIHRAWPYILNRLAPTEEPYVVLEAAGLVESLAMHVGEFMSRRILDDVWPRFRILLAKQEKEDEKAAFGGGGIKYSTSHRLYRSILQTLLHVARDVPLKEAILWGQAVLMRRFLSVAMEPELQTLAGKLYRALGAVNSDATWLALAGAIGVEESLPRYLRMDRVDFETNVERLLGEL